MPLIQQVEVYNTATNFSTWLAFSPASAQDIDGDGLSNAAEAALGTDPENADTDGDGMSDGYEVANGLNPKVNDASGDLDGDGMTNLQEFLAGTAANSTSSTFKILSVVPSPGGYTVTWSCVAGKKYRLQAASDLGTGFADVSVDINATGSITNWPNATADGQRFYRVKLISP